MGCRSISPRPQCPKSKQPLSPQTALYPCEKRLPQWVEFLYSAIHLQQLKVNKTHPKVSAVLTHSSSGACTQKKLLNRWLHLWSHGEKLSQKTQPSATCREQRVEWTIFGSMASDGLILTGSHDFFCRLGEWRHIYQHCWKCLMVWFSSEYTS